METSIVYAYDGQRKSFGKQPQFSSTPEIMLDSINPNPAEQKLYGLRNPVSRHTEALLPMSENEINTIRVEYKTCGMNHAEGGWPKEIHYNNEEETLRYRKRIERDDSYVHAVMSLTPTFEKCIHQNNAIDIYQKYFDDKEEMMSFGKGNATLNNVYKDPNKRPVARLCWTNEDDTKLAVSYCFKEFPKSGPVNANVMCYLWDLENPHQPASEFLPPTACWDIAASPTNPAIIIGGLEDGRVCVFDLRVKTGAVAVSSPHVAHRDPVTAIIYITSRHNHEFFTGSSDGQCKWHDIRDLSEPIANLIMTVNIPRGETISCSNAEGISALQFDRALPTRFLAGTETGLVINVNCKGKTQQEVMSGIYKAHLGPVRAVHRSPCSTKMLLTCGDWTVHVWGEDIKSAPIITGMMHRYQLMDAVWAPERLSSYMTVSADGKFRYWDLLRKYREPVISMQMSKFPLLKIKPHENGQLVAMGDQEGTVFLVSLSPELVLSDPKDKQQMLQLFERECRREQILTTRLKEIRLKIREAEEADPLQKEEKLDDDAVLRTAEDEYRRAVINAFRDNRAPPSTDPMRKR